MAEPAPLFPSEATKRAAAAIVRAEGLSVSWRWGRAFLELRTNFALPLFLSHGYDSSPGSLHLGSACCGDLLTPYHLTDADVAYCSPCQRLQEISPAEQCSGKLDHLGALLSSWLPYYLPPLEAELVATDLASLIWLLHDQELGEAAARGGSRPVRTSYESRVSYE